eukprot:293622_1
MEQFIRFRMQAKTLSVDEYRTFLCNVLDESNMEDFSSLIFNHLYQKWKKQNYEQTSDGLQLSQVNDTISSIIAQRGLNRTKAIAYDNETDGHDVSPPSIKLNHLTDNLIQEIASYLPFRSYSNFQRCCRSIFYAANTPSTLYEVDTDIITGVLMKQRIGTGNVHQIRAFVKRFERVQTLSMDVFSADKKRYIPFMKFTNLKQLKVIVKRANDLKINAFNWRDIRVLDVSGSSATDVLQIVKRCQYLTTLIISCCGNRRETWTQLFANLECLPKLQCLKLGECTGINARVMMKNICNTLRSLGVYSPMYNLDGLTFSTLEELHLVYPKPADITSIIQRTLHLKHLIVKTNNLTHPDLNLSLRNVFELMTLEYCCIWVDRYGMPTNFTLLASLIEVCLHKQRDRFRFKLSIDSHQLTVGEIQGGTVWILNTLRRCTDEFMLCIELRVQVYLELNTMAWLDDIAKTCSVHVDKTIQNNRYGNAVCLTDTESDSCYLLFDNLCRSQTFI